MKNEKNLALLSSLYGVHFPDDFFQFWEFVNALDATEPRLALWQRAGLGLRLFGPYDLVANAFSLGDTSDAFYLKDRYPYDPPEFVTVMKWMAEGLHWGYFWDDPEAGGQPFVCSYYTGDITCSLNGDTLFTAVRKHLEEYYRDISDEMSADDEQEPNLLSQRNVLDALRMQLQRFTSHDEPEHGDAYLEKYVYGSSWPPQDAKRIPTLDGAGLRVPSESYRSIPMESMKAYELWMFLQVQENAEIFLQEGQLALREGYAGTALKVGKDLWTCGYGHLSFELLQGAYRMLGRNLLADRLQTHYQHFSASYK